LAIADGALDAQQATQLALLDEAFQAEQWGEDAQAAARRMNLSREIEITVTFLRLSTPPGR
jgi:chaperone required for assembly of F1-ATPase